MASGHEKLVRKIFGDALGDVSGFTDESWIELGEVLLKNLIPREEKVLRMRYGISSKPDLSLEQVGQDFAETQERIHEIEARALLGLRRSRMSLS